MKNTESYTIRKSISMGVEEFENLICEKLFNKEIESVKITDEDSGIDFQFTDELLSRDDYNFIEEHDICKKLSEYFDVSVTSFHSDKYYEYPMIFVLFDD